MGWFGKAPPRTRPVTKLPCPLGLGEEEGKYPPPPAPPAPISSLGFPSGGRVPTATAPSAGLLAMGIWMLVMGRTTLVTTVGAILPVPREGYVPASCGKVAFIPVTEAELTWNGTCPPPPFPSLGPPLSSSAPPMLLFSFFSRFLSRPSSLSLLPVVTFGENAKEEWTGWKVR